MTLLSILLFTSISQARMGITHGGVSGGGGNVINPKPPIYAMDSESAEHIIKASFKYVRLYVHAQKNRYRNGEMNDQDLSIYSKIFDGEKDIVQAMENFRPKVQEHQPCFDYDRNPVDASVVSPSPGTFCVSAHSLAQKVHHEEIPAQSTALMIHEYSEIIGLSEEEAVVLQKKTLEDLKDMNLPPLQVEDDND